MYYHKPDPIAREDVELTRVVGDTKAGYAFGHLELGVVDGLSTLVVVVGRLLRNKDTGCWELHDSTMDWQPEQIVTDIEHIREMTVDFYMEKPEVWHEAAEVVVAKHNAEDKENV